MQVLSRRYLSRCIVSLPKRWSSDSMVVHRDSETNNSQTPFKFTAENMKRIEVMLTKYPVEYK
ncbi:unnamed protein product, partial [Onchocerca ochengi]